MRKTWRQAFEWNCPHTGPMAVELHSVIMDNFKLNYLLYTNPKYMYTPREACFAGVQINRHRCSVNYTLALQTQSIWVLITVRTRAYVCVRWTSSAWEGSLSKGWETLTPNPQGTGYTRACLLVHVKNASGALCGRKQSSSMDKKAAPSKALWIAPRVQWDT